MSKTKIITIEGIDGSGKTVQFELLTKGLQDRGFTVQNVLTLFMMLFRRTGRKVPFMFGGRKRKHR